MLNFPEGYLKKEERSGFVVSEMMKRVWASQLEMLANTYQVCEKHDIKCYIYWGSLIGAVRHNGYIPWDDDVDVAMMRDDYIKFLDIAQYELPDYMVNNSYTDTECDIYFTRLTNGNKISFERSFLERNHGCPFAVGIDIFPLYNLPRDEGCRNELVSILDVIKQLTTVVNYYGRNAWNVPEIKENTKLLEEVTGYTFSTDKSLKNQLFILYDQLCRIYSDEEADYVTAFPSYLSKGYKVDRKLLGKRVMKYEFIDVVVPEEYDKILSMTYGNYMFPCKSAAAHDYPYFKGQLKMIAGHIEEANNEKMRTSPQLSGLDLINSGKKVIAYYCNPEGLLLHTEYAIEKIRTTLLFFKGESDFVLWYIPFDLNEGKYPLAKTMTPDFYDEYCALIEEIKNEDWIVCDQTGDYGIALEYCDGVYGDEGAVADMFIQADKPVIYQNYEKLDVNN